MMFEWTINIGHVITLLSIVVGAVVAFTSIQWRIKYLDESMDNIRQRMDTMNEAFAALSKTLNQVAVQDSRIQMLEKMVDELRHGEGFIRKTTRR